jgi:hypothetical protein
LREAVSCGLLSVDADRETYTFRHVLTQEAVLNRMLPGEPESCAQFAVPRRVR